MINILRIINWQRGRLNECFDYSVDGCNSAKYFLQQLEESSLKPNICIDRLSGYEIVSIANQKLSEMVEL